MLICLVGFSLQQKELKKEVFGFSLTIYNLLFPQNTSLFTYIAWASYLLFQFSSFTPEIPFLAPAFVVEKALISVTQVMKKRHTKRWHKEGFLRF